MKLPRTIKELKPNKLRKKKDIQLALTSWTAILSIHYMMSAITKPNK